MRRETNIANEHYVRRPACRLAVLGVVAFVAGCVSLDEYVHNGFKVGPNYEKPSAPVEQEWIDASDKRLRTPADDLSKWWEVLKDPMLDRLICQAYHQNL